MQIYIELEKCNLRVLSIRVVISRTSRKEKARWGAPLDDRNDRHAPPYLIRFLGI